MTENYRLLTSEEWAEACDAAPTGSTCRDCRIAICEAQDVKTLRVIGEMTEERFDEWCFRFGQELSLNPSREAHCSQLLSDFLDEVEVRERTLREAI